MADTITIQTSSSTDVVKIIERGPQGPQGPAGSGGGGDVESVNGQTGVVVLAAADVGAASSNDARLTDARTPTSHTHGNLTNDGKIGTTANLPVKTGTSGVLEAGAFGTAAGQFAEGNHTHAANAITSGTLNFNRVMQQVSIESSGTELSPDVLDLTSYIVGGNLHALAIILSAQANAYTEVVLPDLTAGALGVVTVRPNYFEDPSVNFVKVTNGTTNIWPASSYIEMDDNEEVTFEWNQDRWDMAIRPFPAAIPSPVAYSIFKPNASGILAINPMTTAGDIVVGGTSGAPARLALGTASQQLRVNSGATGLEYFTSQAIVSNTTGITGADAVTNIVSLTQAEYNAIGSPNAATLYLITDP